MRGACSGCPSSTATLKHGIQNLLRHFVPEVVEVQPMNWCRRILWVISRRPGASSAVFVSPRLWTGVSPRSRF